MIEFPPPIDPTAPQPTMPVGMISWEGAVVRCLQLMNNIDNQLITPQLAVERIEEGLKAAHDSVTTMREVIDNQLNVLNAFAAMLQLPQGSLYADMIPLVQALINKSAEDAPPLQ